MSDGTCSGCKHWDREDDWNHAVSLRNNWGDDGDAIEAEQDRLNLRFGICSAINEGWDLTVEQAEQVKATVWDGSSYRASIHTRDDFGCVLFDAASSGTEQQT